MVTAPVPGAQAGVRAAGAGAGGGQVTLKKNNNKLDLRYNCVKLQVLSRWVVGHFSRSVVSQY